jgi:hypothetical protein
LDGYKLLSKMINMPGSKGVERQGEGQGAGERIGPNNVCIYE